MPTIFDDVLDLKNKAKNRRDMGLYDRCIDILQKTIQILRSDFDISETDLNYRSRIASELADCYGMIGGAERRWALDEDLSSAEKSAHLINSIVAYDIGYYEFECKKELSVVTSYNLLNRLVSRILFNPEMVDKNEISDGGGRFKPLLVIEELSNAADEIFSDIRSGRRDDYWAAADLALVELLLERRDARSAYSRFISMSPPAFAFESVIVTLDSLHNLEWSRSGSFGDAKDYLERHMSMI